MAITLTQIRAFLAVKSAGSVHAAAGQLLVSQPSVSAAVASLADELGTALLERHGRGVRLTDSGEAFAPYAAQVLGLLEQGTNAAREAAHPERSTIRLIAVNTAGEYLVPPLIRAYRQLHPGINILLADLDLSAPEPGSPELLTLGSNGAIKQGLAVGLGVTLISRFAVARELRDGLLVEIGVPGTPLTRPWHVLFPPSGPQRPAVRAFGEFLRSEHGRRIIDNYL